MIKRLEHKIIITPKDIKPTREDFEVIGVFNPGAVRVGDDIYLLVRVAEQPVERREGYFPFPRADIKKGETVIDWLEVKKEGMDDMRSYKLSDGTIRLTFISHLRLVKLDEKGFNITETDKKPTVFPEEDYEEYGVEDPRISEINGTYYITYVGVSGKTGVCTALLLTGDFKEFERGGNNISNGK